MTCIRLPAKGKQRSTPREQVELACPSRIDRYSPSNQPHVNHPKPLCPRTLQRQVVRLIVVPHQHGPVEVLAQPLDAVAQLDPLPAVELRELQQVMDQRIDRVVEAALRGG